MVDEARRDRCPFFNHADDLLLLVISDKLWYCRLSPNHKVLHFGDVEEDTETPPIESLQEKSELLTTATL